MTCEQLHLSLYIVRSLATGVQMEMHQKTNCKKHRKGNKGSRRGNTHQLKYMWARLYVVVCIMLSLCISGGFHFPNSCQSREGENIWRPCHTWGKPMKTRPKTFPSGMMRVLGLNQAVVTKKVQPNQPGDSKKKTRPKQLHALNLVGGQIGVIVNLLVLGWGCRALQRRW